jgi:hypothetical protein
MKFLVFNAIVAAALLYLFNDGQFDGEWSIKGLLDRSVADVSATPKPATKPTITPDPAPEPKLVKAAPAAPKAIDTAPKIDPAVAKRRAEVLAVSTKAPASPPFISNETRRDSLMTMAEDMELFSVEAMAR